MATADLGAIDSCGPLSLSPFIDLRSAFIARLMLATVRAEATDSRFELARDIADMRRRRYTHMNGTGKEGDRYKERGEEICIINGAPSSWYKLYVLCSRYPMCGMISSGGEMSNQGENIGSVGLSTAQCK